MADYYEREARDFDAYERLKDEIKQRYAGKYVAIADGRLVAVSDDFREAWNAVCDHKHFLVFAAEEEPQRDEIWLRRRCYLHGLSGYRVGWNLQGREIQIARRR